MLIPILWLNIRLLAYSFTSSNDSSYYVLKWSNRRFHTLREEAVVPVVPVVTMGADEAKMNVGAVTIMYVNAGHP